MKKLNNKGFTLIEVIVAVVILAILAMLFVPSVTSLLNKNKNDSYESLKDSILVAAKEYVNDNRYNTELECVTGSSAICFDNGVLVGNVYIKTLLDEGYLSPSGTNGSSEYIIDPRDGEKRLILTSSYVKVSFNSSKKDYELELLDGYLNWN